MLVIGTPGLSVSNMVNITFTLTRAGLFQYRVRRFIIRSHKSREGMWIMRFKSFWNLFNIASQSDVLQCEYKHNSWFLCQQTVFNKLIACDEYVPPRTWSPSLHVIAWHLCDGKLLWKPMIPYCHLEYLEQLIVKYEWQHEHLQSRNAQSFLCKISWHQCSKVRY